MIPVWCSTSIDSTTEGRPRVCILWRGGESCPVSAAWHSCVAAHWSNYYCYKQAPLDVKATLNLNKQTTNNEDIPLLKQYVDFSLHKMSRLCLWIMACMIWYNFCLLSGKTLYIHFNKRVEESSLAMSALPSPNWWSTFLCEFLIPQLSIYSLNWNSLLIITIYVCYWTMISELFPFIISKF